MSRAGTNSQYKEITVRGRERIVSFGTCKYDDCKCRRRLALDTKYGQSGARPSHILKAIFYLLLFGMTLRHIAVTAPKVYGTNARSANVRCHIALFRN